MTTQELAPRDIYSAAFEALQGADAGASPRWAWALRERAFARFSELGFPTARRGNEEWKYTDVRPIARAAFQPYSAGEPSTLAPGGLEGFTLGEARWSRLVFVNGRYAPGLSRAGDLPAGVRPLSIPEALESMGHLVEPHLARLADCDGNAFTALNTAFLRDGALLHLPEGAVVREPVHVLFLTTAGAADAMTQPRLLVVAGAESQATVVETYGGVAGDRYFTNAVTEVVLGPGALVEHHRVQGEGARAFHVNSTHVELGRDSRFTSVAMDLGGALTRNNLSVVARGEGGSCMLNGVYLVAGSQHVDNQVVVDHAAPHTSSRELYKGVLSGRSRSVFHGSIIVRPGAQKVDAHQADKNLLLSDEAEADTKPAFWVYADDVKCGHGAACGQIDANALLYLRSRGIDEGTARAMLVRGFVGEVVESISNERVRTHAEGLIAARLQGLLGDGEPPTGGPQGTPEP